LPVSKDERFAELHGAHRAARQEVPAPFYGMTSSEMLKTAQAAVDGLAWAW
jgi:hypothetical protein